MYGRLPWDRLTSRNRSSPRKTTNTGMYYLVRLTKLLRVIYAYPWNMASLIELFRLWSELFPQLISIALWAMKYSLFRLCNANEFLFYVAATDRIGDGVELGVYGFFI